MAAAATPQTGTGQTGAVFGWFGIFRVGLVQMAIGSIVLLMTSTFNRVMVVELALPAVVPGALVGLHYAVQLSRPHWGHGADRGGARWPWIVGGVGLLALGAVGAALSATLVPVSAGLGVAAAALAFFVIGVGVGASGTNLLALLAARTPAARKAPAAAIVWIMMILGFVITAASVGKLLEPFSLGRLVAVTAGVAAAAVLLTGAALFGLERPGAAPAAAARPRGSFRDAVAAIWEETAARRFTVFIFVSMLAYSVQDLILEPFCGLVFGYSVAESTALSGVQHGGVLIGMIVTAVVGAVVGRSRAGFMRKWTVVGCLASGAALVALAGAATVGPGWPLAPSIFALGLANGAFAVAAIGSMMTLASAGGGGREGVRMGLWGASQAIAFGLGGFLGAAALDVARAALGEAAPAFLTVFAVEGALFVLAGWLAWRVGVSDADARRLPVLPAGDLLPAE